MSSVFEGTSNALLEAIGYSVPTIVTDVGDNAYIILRQIMVWYLCLVIIWVWQMV